MSVSMNYTMSVSALGVSGAWDGALTNEAGHVHSPSTIYTGVAPATWALASTGTMTNTSFTLATPMQDPTYPGYLTSNKWTIYWIDAVGRLCAHYGVTFTNADGVGTLWTGATVGNGWYRDDGTYPTDLPTATSAAPNGITGVVICPEFIDTTVPIVAANCSVFVATGRRVGLAILADGGTNYSPYFVGGRYGTFQPGTVTFVGKAAGGSGAVTTSTRAIYSTYDTTASQPPAFMYLSVGA
jgi:hypothetical protein